jgi:hypothetical protein
MARLSQPIYATATQCTVCGTVFHLWRQQSRRKKAGHGKHVYCLTCEDVTLHSEMREDPLDRPQKCL